MFATALSLLGLAATAPSAGAAPAFAPGPVLETGAQPVAAIGDVDGDGRPDIVSASRRQFFDGEVRVHLATADGFRARAPIAIEARPTTVRLVDFDADGRLDVHVDTDMGRATILQQDATGAFAAPRPVPTGPHTVVADFNGDGRADLAYGDGMVHWPRGVRIGLSGPDGTQAWSTVETPHYAEELVAADFDRDGFTDLVAIDPGDDGSFLRGSAAGLTRTSGYGRDLPRETLADDINGDGLLDLVWPDHRVEHVIVRRGLADGSLTRELWHPVAGTPTALQTRDLDGDGLRDVAMSLQREVVVLPGVPGGELGAPIRYPLAGWSDRLAIGDLDGDGRPDLVTAEDDALRLHLNRTRVMTVTTPASSRTATFPLAWTVTGFLTALESARLTVRGPGETEFRNAVRTLPSVGSGRVDFHAYAGDGEYRFRVVATDWRGRPLETLTPQESVTVVDTRTPEPPRPPEPTPTPVPDVQPEATATPTPVPLAATAPTVVPPAPARIATAARVLFDAGVPGRTSTRLRRLRVVDVPTGGTVDVRCAKGCPARRYTRYDAAGTVSLARFATRPLKAGTRIAVTIAAPGARTVRTTIVVRARKAPAVTTR